jgi:hypothetical protein
MNVVNRFTDFLGMTSEESRAAKEAAIRANERPIHVHNALQELRKTELFKVIFDDYLIYLRKYRQEQLTNLISASILNQEAIEAMQREIVKYKHVEMFLDEVEQKGKEALAETIRLKKEISK